MPFRHAHATHPDWLIAAELCLAQLEGLSQQAPYSASANLGIVYFTDYFSAHANELVQLLKQRTGVSQWVGGVGLGIAATGVEYFDEPALAVMLCDFPEGSFRVFSGRAPLPMRPMTDSSRNPTQPSPHDPHAQLFLDALRQPTPTNAPPVFTPYSALVHSAPNSLMLPDLVQDMASKTSARYLFGGLVSGRDEPQQVANDVITGGMSGVAFDARVALISRVTQGCQPISKPHVITASEGHEIQKLDHQAALDLLITDLGLQDPEVDAPVNDSTRNAIRRMSRGLYCAIGKPDAQTDMAGDRIKLGQFGRDFMVRHLVSIDPHQRSFSIIEAAPVGSQLAFCVRDAAASRADLIRICAELREELEPHVDELQADHHRPSAMATSHASRQIKGAIYMSCIARGGEVIGEGLPESASAELKLIAQYLGDIPLVGLFGGGEIAFDQLYSYSGVLTLFV